MAEMNNYHEKILYLATAFRSGFSEKEKSAFEKKQKKFHIPKTPKQHDYDILNITGIDNGNKREGTGVPKQSIEEELAKWKLAFSELRPPLNFSKRRHFQSGLKLMNKSCEEILHVVGSYRENLESEKECKGDWKMEEEANESVYHLWSIDDAEFVDNPEDEELIYEIGESNETPIPRNLAHF